MKKASDDLRQLERKLAELQYKEDKVCSVRDKNRLCGGSFYVGVRIATEMLSALVVGGALGYLFDMVLNVKPWGMVLFLFFGGAAGFLNVYRLAKNEDEYRGE